MPRANGRSIFRTLGLYVLLLPRFIVGQRIRCGSYNNGNVMPHMITDGDTRNMGVLAPSASLFAKATNARPSPARRRGGVILL